MVALSNQQARLPGGRVELSGEGGVCEGRVDAGTSDFAGSSERAPDVDQVVRNDTQAAPALRARLAFVARAVETVAALQEADPVPGDPRIKPAAAPTGSGPMPTRSYTMAKCLLCWLVLGLSRCPKSIDWRVNP